MAWAGIVMGVGIMVMILGGLAVLGGLSVALVGPAIVDDSQDGDQSIVPFSQSGREDDEARAQRQEIRLLGGSIMLAGAAAVLVGGVVFSVARGVEAAQRHRTTN